MLAPGAVRIHGLRIRGAENARAAVAGALEQADWSIADEEEVLILRTLRVGAPLRGIGFQAVDAARALARRAADGWQAGADRGEAVRFASRAELLACLAWDLLRHRPRWFWRGWRGLFDQPAGMAVARALAAEPLSWPDVVGHLERRDLAEHLWHGLEPADARQVLAALERATGWPVSRCPPPDAPALQDRPSPAMPTLPIWLADVARATRPMADDAPLRLAIVTWLWAGAPQRLAHAEAGGQVAALARALRLQAGSGQVEAASGVAPSAEMAGAARMAASPEGPGAAQSNGPEPSPSQPPPLAGEAPDRPVERRLSPAPRAGRAGVGGSSDPPAPSPAPSPSDRFHCPRTPPETRFVTSRGGWFYLLNALALQACQDRLPAESADHAVGWLWLYRLGRSLGGRPDPPLALFLADAAGFADPASMDARPPLPCEEDLVRLARARYGDAACNAGLFARPALVWATPSHLDVHFRMADARLDVRRAGLDIDPGWLTWLGRVVRFHYGTVPELAGLPEP